MKSLHFCTFLIIFFGTVAVHGSENPAPIQLLERVAKTGESSQEEIKLILRLPPGHTAETPTARGVLAFCTWEQEEASLRKRLQNSDDPLIKYATKHKLAVLTWNTATLWKTGKSFDQISRQERKNQDQVFDSVARAWERGVKQLCTEHALPQGGFLLYGISRGAHWSCRLALRYPKRFLAVHIHVANSYDKAVGSAAGPLWLVSSGDLDRGRDSALAFYRLCQSKGFPIVLKVANGLGHSGSPEIDRLRDGFFEYAFEAAGLAGDAGAAAVMLEDLKTSGLVGDLLTQEVYRGAEIHIVPESQKVPLPHEKLARAWGHLRQ